MFGLEERERDPGAGAGLWPAKRTGQLLDTARMATADGLIASGCHWSVPALRGVPTEYQFFGGLNAAARLAKTLVASGIAQADVWLRAGRDPFRFIEQTLRDRIEAHGGQEIDTDLFLGVGLVSDLDPCGTDVGELADGNEMYLVVEPESAGYVVLGPTLGLLEAVHPRLPVTFFNFFTHALNRWVRVYDYLDAAYSRVVDRDGSVWFGEGRGVHRFAYNSLVQLQLPHTHGHWFTLAPDDGGTVWISSGSGTGSSTLYRVADGKAEFERPQHGVANFAYRAPDKTFWFAGEGGLWHMVSGRLTRIDLPRALVRGDQYLQAIVQDRSGGMWVSFWNRGLYRLANGVWTQYGGRRDLPTQRVHIEFMDRLGRIWFGSRNNVLAVLEGDRVQTLGPSDGVRVGDITAIHGRGSEIWVGGEFGLQQFDQGSFHSINAVNSECIRGISGIVQTANGDLWLNGLAALRIRQPAASAPGRPARPAHRRRKSLRSLRIRTGCCGWSAGLFSASIRRPDASPLTGSIHSEREGRTGKVPLLSL